MALLSKFMSFTPILDVSCFLVDVLFDESSYFDPCYAIVVFQKMLPFPSVGIKKKYP